MTNDLTGFIPLAEYARQRSISIYTLSSRIRRGNIPADCIQHVGRTVLIRDQDYPEPAGNKKGAVRTAGGRPPKNKSE